MKYVYNQEGIEQVNNYINDVQPSKVFILTDYQTQKFCLPVIEKQINMEFTNVNFKNGDQYKNLETLQKVWRELIEADADRKSLLINLGGGVVTDLGGLAAATFKRGIKFIHIPTSLLGMVDAAIGGKNGINFQHLKNQIGTIVQPEIICIYPEFLKTLPKKEIASGYAEMLKHGLIKDKNYWQQLLENYNKENQVFPSHLIKRSVEIKNEIITQDPHEQNIRKLLNFGHTLGHAIESYLNYELNMPVTHGHAVAIGMILEAFLSNLNNGLSTKELVEITKSINLIYPYIDFDNQAINKIINLLKFDKKNENGKILFVLLKEIGKADFNKEVPTQDVIDAFDYYKKSRK